MTPPSDTKRRIACLTKALIAGQSRRQGADIDATLAVLLEDTAEFPVSILEAAAEAWRRTELFWPTSAELIALCRAEQPTPAQPYRPALPAPERHVQTPEEHQESADFLAKLGSALNQGPRAARDFARGCDRIGPPSRYRPDWLDDPSLDDTLPAEGYPQRRGYGALRKAAVAMPENWTAHAREAPDPMPEPTEPAPLTHGQKNRPSVDPAETDPRPEPPAPEPWF